MGIQFAESNNLTYMLNKYSFLGNSRDADLNWIMGPLQRRFPVQAASERGLNQWARAYNYHGTIGDALLEYHRQHFDTFSYRGFYGGVTTGCGGSEGGRLLEKWSFLLQLFEKSTGLINERAWSAQSASVASLDLDFSDVAAVGMEKDKDTMIIADDLVQEETAPLAHSGDYNIVNRIEIHLRFEDISSVLDPGIYRKVIEGLVQGMGAGVNCFPRHSLCVLFSRMRKPCSGPNHSPIPQKYHFPRQNTTTN